MSICMEIYYDCRQIAGKSGYIDCLQRRPIHDNQLEYVERRSIGKNV